jgi:predicted nucleic acid-binding protein
MASLIVIDTDVLIDAARNIDTAVQCLEQIQARTGLAISVVTQMELIIGCRNKQEFRSLERFLARFQIIPIDEYMSLKAVDLLTQYRLSHGLLIADALIAATAIHLGQPLISKNQRDYQFIEGLQLLSYPSLSPLSETT